MRPLTLLEAAQFLRMSKSSLYHRKDIPRYRRPGSRALLFDQDELEAWLKTGRIDPASITGSTAAPSVHIQVPRPGAAVFPLAPEVGALDIPRSGVYHRNPLYR